MPEQQQPAPPQEDYESRINSSSPLPVVTPAGEAKGMLPGIAGIALYLLLMAMVNAFAASTGVYGASGTVRYSALAFSTLLLVGVYGLLRLRRWGWALVIGACLFMGSGYLYAFTRSHRPQYVINGLFAFVFFLYLSRTEVRERVH